MKTNTSSRLSPLTERLGQATAELYNAAGLSEMRSVQCTVGRLSPSSPEEDEFCPIVIYRIALL